MVTGNYYTENIHKKEALPESKASKIFMKLPIFYTRSVKI